MFSMRRFHPLRAALFGIIALAPAFAGDGEFLVRAPGNSIQRLLNKGAKILSSTPAAGENLYVVTIPGAAHGAALNTILSVSGVSAEPNHSVTLPEASVASATSANSPLTFPNVRSKLQEIVYSIAAGSCASGISVFHGYYCQPAVGIINLPEARKFASGVGVVGVLDTGIDPTHPALAGSVIPGWDFTTNSAGGYVTVSDMQSTTSILDQSTTSILDQSTTSILDQSTTSILDQSTTSILDQSTTSILDNRPKNCAGHGTMVAGMVHLVAPGARLMPIKVFGPDGTAPLSLIVAGVYWAADHGVKILNMSFDMTAPSSELQKAVSYAVSQGVVLVAAAGNEGKVTMVYPAGLHTVIGVGATNDNDIRESYSNYGPVVTLAAPDGVITTYPGGRWALAYGTSLSSPEVAGAIALLYQMNPSLDGDSAVTGITQCAPVGQQLGAGRLDLFRACSYQASHSGDR
jgi:hypothetical protein